MAAQRCVHSDEEALQLLVDLRSCVSSTSPVQGCITALLVSHQPSESAGGGGGGSTAGAPEGGAGAGRVISFGYNRSLLAATRAGAADEDQRRGRQSHKKNARKANLTTDVHAEADAICSAAATPGTSSGGTTLYVTCVCCENCFALAVAAGVKRIVTPPPPTAEFYGRSRPRLLAMAALHGVELVEVPKDKMPGHRRDSEERDRALVGLLPRGLVRRLGRGADALLPAALRGVGAGAGAHSCAGRGGCGGCGVCGTTKAETEAEAQAVPGSQVTALAPLALGALAGAALVFLCIKSAGTGAERKLA